jgi:hypothetical protein
VLKLVYAVNAYGRVMQSFFEATTGDEDPHLITLPLILAEAGNGRCKHRGTNGVPRAQSLESGGTK